MKKGSIHLKFAIEKSSENKKRIQIKAKEGVKRRVYVLYTSMCMYTSYM